MKNNKNSKVERRWQKRQQREYIERKKKEQAHEQMMKYVKYWNR